MTVARTIPARAVILGCTFCCLAIAGEFALGFYHRGISLNILLGLAWLVIAAFALVTYRLRGLWVLVSVPVAIFLINDVWVQIAVACSLNSQNCP